VHADDCAIHDFLERRPPDRFDAFMQAVGRALHAMLPSLKRKARRYGGAVDVDEAVGQAVERALTYLRGQYLGDAAAFRFDRSFGLSFQAWVLRILRLVALEQIRKEKRSPSNAGGTGGDLEDLERAEPFAAVAAAETVACETEVRWKALDIEALTDRLKPRQQFVVCADFGFHNEGPLDGAAIARLAAKVGLPAGEVRKMRQRAATVWPAGAKPAHRLSQAQIGRLLDVSERQVHNIKRDALNALRSGAAAQ
jgi:DNA-directed RNA polymerase specialized sigma24 family protein